MLLFASTLSTLAGMATGFIVSLAVCSPIAWLLYRRQSAAARNARSVPLPATVDAQRLAALEPLAPRRSEQDR